MLATIKSRLPEGLKVVLRKIRKIIKSRSLGREFLSRHYLRGHGIEIGALHNPLTVGFKAQVKYVDRFNNEGLKKHYPEQRHQDFVDVDIVDDGEFLSRILDNSQNFVIANHFLEHCQNPLLTLKQMHRVLKNNGILYLALPDKRYTFDIKRPVTSLEHLLKDFREGAEISEKDHYEEWVSLVNEVSNINQMQQAAEKLMAEKYSIHFHVWTQNEILEMFISLKKEIGIHFEIECCLKNGVEFITILRKVAD
jgi:predicted SAM-dependent methyltransferase